MKDLLKDIVWLKEMNYLIRGPTEKDVHFWRWQFTRRAKPYQDDFIEYARDCFGIDCSKTKYYDKTPSQKIIKLKVNLPPDDGINTIWDYDCGDKKWLRLFREKHNIYQPRPHWRERVDWFCLGPPVISGQRIEKSSGYRVVTDKGRYLNNRISVTLDLTCNYTTLMKCLDEYVSRLDKSFKPHRTEIRIREEKTYLKVWDVRQKIIDSNRNVTGKIVCEKLLLSDHELIKSIAPISDSKTAALKKVLSENKGAGLSREQIGEDEIKRVERYLREADNRITNYKEYGHPPVVKKIEPKVDLNDI
jgi:hypothetical protein